ncbi:MAG: hypothetical protein KME40_24955 [Komarekiella atlantica HA4396-MV6]|jgi:hypothetical protein|nr:hypothetical protein [Komarekiella atlantica HA4396-MV6]
MAKIIISNLPASSNENLLTELESWEMNSVEGGLRRRRRRRGTSGTTGATGTTGSTITIDTSVLTATIDDMNGVLDRLSAQLNQTLESVEVVEE